MLHPVHVLMPAVLCAAAWSCTIARERLPGEGAHPAGWGTVNSAAFHGQWLRESGYPLADCRACHGDDYAGGAVGVGCKSGSCHTQGVESCGTCHGTSINSRPDSGAHSAHGNDCVSCHPVPQVVESGNHLNGQADLLFAGLATAGGAMPAWDARTQVCSNSYCHGSVSPPWTGSGPLGCDACHGAPPDSHARFARVASACADCHLPVPGATHVNGGVELGVSECDACHGSGLEGAPGPALDGATDRAAVGVGAHQRHVDRTLADRTGKYLTCATCHPVPAAIADQGHIDSTAPADVDLPLGGSYDPQSATCVVWCHWDRAPGPLWTDDSGAARQCDGCHGFPPLRTRAGAAHPDARPELAVCLQCHSFHPFTHVDGEVNIP
jgi:predicted CxxxxCH...CXXCH cytochrome family protein